MHDPIKPAHFLYQRSQFLDVLSANASMRDIQHLIECGKTVWLLLQQIGS
jgi:hypothetical protein